VQDEFNTQLAPMTWANDWEIISPVNIWMLYVVCYVHGAYYFSVVNSCHRSELSNDCCMLFVHTTVIAQLAPMTWVNDWEIVSSVNITNNIQQSLLNSLLWHELTTEKCMLFAMFTELTISQSLTHVIGASWTMTVVCCLLCSRSSLFK
jgi:hypothetical protein